MLQNALGHLEMHTHLFQHLVHSLKGLLEGFTLRYACLLDKPLPNCKLAFMKKVLCHNLQCVCGN